jgi:hypothetical protein
MTPFILAGVIIQNANIMLALGTNAARIKPPETRCTLIIFNSIFMPNRQPGLSNDRAPKHSALIGRQTQIVSVVVKILTARAVECSLDIKSGSQNFGYFSVGSADR